MELTELSPVRQWARGGELRATGHHRSVHHWAMPTHRGEAGEEEEEHSVISVYLLLLDHNNKGEVNGTDFEVACAYSVYSV